MTRFKVSSAENLGVHLITCIIGVSIIFRIGTVEVLKACDACA